MGIFDLFSKRQKRDRGEVPDVFLYNEVPKKLRVQIVHIIGDTLGEDRYSSNYAKNAYQFINDTLCREYGLFKLTEYPNSTQESVFNFFLSCDDYERALDVIELSFKTINIHARKNGFSYNTETKLSPDDAIEELNGRLKEQGIGFQFESNELIRVDSEYLHSEIVKPTLALLRDKLYKGANEEFLKSHEHYRHGRYKECLNEALKSFESVMKIICTKHKWAYKQSDTSKTLISVCFNNGLIPSYLQSQFSSLRSVLESGIPTVRNKLGGHGQGSQAIAVPEEMARYALNLTASNIVFLVEHEKIIK